MIKMLQIKFVAIAMGSIFLVMFVIIGSINFVNLYQIEQKTDSLLTLLSNNDGKFPEFEKDKLRYRGSSSDINPKMTIETQFETRYFIVKSDKNNKIDKVDTLHVAAVSHLDAQKYAQNILSSQKKEGYYNSYKYLVTNKPYGSLIVFVDNRSQLHTGISFLKASSAISLISLLLVFILVYVFSRKAIEPVIASMEKQKQFITDAGHEIKTPLAIISANTDILEIRDGKSEWTDSIRNQTNRLNNLVKNLLALSRLEEGSMSMKFSRFSLSEAVEDVAMQFKTLGETNNLQFSVEIEPNLNMFGDETSIRQLVSILVDNAVKYASEGGEIKITLFKSGKYMKVDVSNTSNDVPKGDLNRLFDRFYRADSSRARETGGYGIGLSIAKAIVESHKGKIIARVEKENIVSFIAIFQ